MRQSIPRVFPFMILLFILGGCALLFSVKGDAEDPLQPGLTPNLQTRGLSRFGVSVIAGYGGLRELVEDIDTLAYEVAVSVIESTQNYYHWGWGWGRTDIALAEADTTSTAQKDSGYATNTQVSGVDEADIVKSDGRFIFLAAGSELVVLDREAPSQDGRIADRLTLFQGGRVSDLLLGTGTILAISGGSGWYSEDAGWAEGTKITLLKIGPEGKLSVKDEKVLGGSYIDARLTGDSAFILTNTYLNYHTLTEELMPHHTDYEGMDEVTRKNAAYNKLDSLILRWRTSVVKSLFFHEGDFDEEMIRNTMRLYNLSDSDEKRRERLPFERPFSSFTQITSFDLTSGFGSIRRAGSFSTNGGWANLYANRNTIVIANNGWEREEVGNWNEVTYLLAFSNLHGIVSPLSAGKIVGYTLNQFSMDVHGGYLRVATTQNARWGFDEAQGEWKEESPSESFITIADINSSPMKEVGKVGDLGRGERIMSARFLGDIAYLVTFRQIDPFYSVDLSDPSMPVVAGELKVPGFSNYLHPMDEGFILAVGQDADDTGVTKGLQIAVYDVTKINSPSQKFKHVIEGYSSSSAQWDHHAFRYLPDRDILILPVNIWERSGTNYSYAGKFMLFSVSEDAKIEGLGEIPYPEPAFTSFLQPRSMVFGDELVTMKGQYILAHDLNNLEEYWRLKLTEDRLW